ncbi:Zn-ribbon domain-containing OB-fold protein [Chloroflexota bacterium]
MTGKKRIPIGEGLFYLPRTENDHPYLIGSKCHSCGYISFPRIDVCANCMQENTMTEIPLSRRGKIETFAIVQRAPSGFEAPYIMAYVNLPEGVRIFSLISGCEPKDDSLKIGQEVELTIDRIREDENGNEIIGWKFQPVA